MKNIIYKISTYVAKFKVYIGRSTTYISIINFALLIATFKKAYNIEISVFVIVPIGVIGGLVIGYLDYKLILKQEIMLNNKKNDVKDQINNIEKILMKMNKVYK